MRKLICILIISIFVFNTVGYFTVFKIEQYFIRQEIKKDLKRGVPKNKLHEFVFSIHDYFSIDWVRKNIEFRINGSMYDVVEMKIESSKLRYLCISDTEETQLFARLNQMVEDEMENNSGPNGMNTRKLIKLVNSLEFLFWERYCSAFISPYETFIFHFPESHRSVFYQEVIGPPPELV